MKRWVVMGLLVLAGCNGSGQAPLEVTGQIEAIDADVGSKIGGRVAEVLVKEGARVAQGAVLVRLEADEAKAALDAALAQLAQADALLTKLQTGARPEELRQAEAAAEVARQQYEMAQKGARSQEIQSAKSTAAAVRAQRDTAKAEYDRVRKLYEQKAVSTQLRDQAQHAYEAAEAQLRAATEQAQMVAEGVRSEQLAMARATAEQAQAALELVRNGARKEDLEAARAARDTAAANVARTETALRETEISAPFEAVVESLDLEPGDIVKPGAVARLVDPHRLKLVVFVSAGVLGRFKVGDRVPLMTDSTGDERFEGTIIQIATEGEYTPRNLQTKEERVQQVFGIKFELDSHDGKLKAGMTATAHFDDATSGAAAPAKGSA